MTEYKLHFHGVFLLSYLFDNAGIGKDSPAGFAERWKSTHRASDRADIFLIKDPLGLKASGLFQAFSPLKAAGREAGTGRVGRSSSGICPV